MRPCIAIIVCAGLAAFGCQPDEFIPPSGESIDARQVDAPLARPDGAPGDALAGDAGPIDGSMADAPPPDASIIDAMPPTYTHDVDIQPVWSANCANASCHPSMANAYDVLVNVPSNQLPSMYFIKPGSSDMSYLWRKLEDTHVAAGGMGEAMPPGGPLKTSTREMIRVWIEEGAPR